MPQTMFDDSDGMLAMLRDSVAGFAERHPGPKALRDKRARSGDFDGTLWSAMAEAGWVGLLLPEDLGGAGLGMREQAERACAVLAYGDLKRVELALALANRPRLLLMDEPTAGMAPDERDALMSLARQLARSDQLAVLFTEHDMDVVFEYADRVIVMHQGEVIAAGLPGEVRGDARVREVYLGQA